MFDMKLVIFVCIYVLTTTEAASCKENQQCHSCDINGQCSSKCAPGYYGKKCTKRCSSNCKHDLCHLTPSGNDHCTYGCNPGFYGTRCNIPCEPRNFTCSKCPQECEEGFCQFGSSCAQGCQDSYYGTACRSCPAWCEVCNRVSGICEVCFHCEGNCTHGCQEWCTTGYFGDFCEHSCSSGCLLGCNQTSGDCFGCKSGWFGATCDKCPDTCLYEECDIDGICTRGCIEGWYGSSCDSKCGTGCVEGRCDRNGTCIEECKLGLYGEQCDKQCPNKCLDEECDTEGNCTHGCIGGWHGPKCESKCTAECAGGRCGRNGTCIGGCKLGLYGEQCNNQCPPFCFNKLCTIADGSCRSCEKGYHGHHCNQSCGRCVDTSCTQNNGHCIHGCLSNYQGEFCQHDCAGNCTTEECRDVCKTENEEAPQYWIAGVSLVFIIFLIVLVFVTYHFKRIDNDLYYKVMWQAQAETREIEQEDRRTCNTLASLHSEQESDCSQVGVQVVVLKQAETGCESLDSLEEDGNVGQHDRELLTKIIMEDGLASDSYNVIKLGVAEKAGEPTVGGTAFILGEDKTPIVMEEDSDSECHNIVDVRKKLKDEKGKIASCSSNISTDGKAKMTIVLEDDAEVDHDVDDKRMLVVTEDEARPYCDNSSGDREGMINPITEDDLVIEDRNNFFRNNPSEEWKNTMKMSDEDVFVCDDSKVQNRSVIRPEAQHIVTMNGSDDVRVGDQGDVVQDLAFDGNGTVLTAKGNQCESSDLTNTGALSSETQVVETFHEPVNEKSQHGLGRVDDHDKNKHYVEVFLMGTNSETMPVKI